MATTATGSGTTGSGTRRATALPPAERRAAIVEAVGPLLREHGAAVTTRQIAEAAGIAEGTIFRVFADKDELLGAAVDDALDTSDLEAALGAIPADLPLDARITAAVDILQRRVTDVWQLLSALGPAGRRRARQPMADGPILDSAALTALFASADEALRIPPEAAARLLRALTLAMTHPMFAADATDPAEIAAVVLHGLVVEP